MAKVGFGPIEEGGSPLLLGRWLNVQGPVLNTDLFNSSIKDLKICKKQSYFKGLNEVDIEYLDTSSPILPLPDPS
jgi:hypothetical protein